MCAYLPNGQLCPRTLLPMCLEDSRAFLTIFSAYLPYLTGTECDLRYQSRRVGLCPLIPTSKGRRYWTHEPHGHSAHCVRTSCAGNLECERVRTLALRQDSTRYRDRQQQAGGSRGASGRSCNRGARHCGQTVVPNRLRRRRRGDAGRGRERGHASRTPES